MSYLYVSSDFPTEDARTVEPVSVPVFIGETQVGIVRDRGQGEVEAIALGRKFTPLGLFSTRNAAIVTIFTASNSPLKHTTADVGCVGGRKRYAAHETAQSRSTNL